jgi:hypothetical protein
MLATVSSFPVTGIIYIRFTGLVGEGFGIGSCTSYILKQWVFESLSCN